MGSFPGKIFAVLLAFILLVFTPLIILSLVQDIRTERVTWNALTDYTDVVSDKGVITQNDYTEFVAKLGASNVNYDISIIVRSKLIFPAPTGSSGYVIKYVTSGLWKSSAGGVTGTTYLEAGDTLQVVVKPLSKTRASSLLGGVLNLHTNTTEYSYAANVRNDGDLYIDG